MVDKFVIQLEEQLSDKGVVIVLSDEARIWLATKGYDSRMGARPLARTIQEYVKKPLAEELLFGRLSKGGGVKIGVKDNKLTFDYEEPKAGETITPVAESEETVE